MDNGERIYLGLMERDDMQKLEEGHTPPRENDLRWENNKYKLSSLVDDLLAADKEA